MGSKIVCSSCHMQIASTDYKDDKTNVCPFCGSTLDDVAAHCSIDNSRLVETVADTGGNSMDLRQQKLTISAGDTIGGYILERPLGKGGAGEVWLAFHPVMERQIALKIFYQSQAESLLFLRYSKEIKISGHLDHKNIVPAYDAGEIDGHWYLAMKYINGASLDKQIRATGAMDETIALSLTKAIVEALLYAYEKYQLLHRDIKPSNLLLDEDGRVYVADMGISKSSLDEMNLTFIGETLGTPYYMSPEQADGVSDIDCRSDIYSLGITLFHMVTGSVPYDGSTTAGVIKKHVNEPFPSPHEYTSDITEHCALLIESMMAKKRENRYQNWKELLDDLNRVIKGGKPERTPVEPRVPLAVMEAELREKKISENLNESAGNSSDDGKEHSTFFTKKRISAAGCMAFCCLILLLSITAGGWIIRGLDTAVTMDEQVNQSWAQVENQLQRRNDLIPNLVNVVKGYMDHEKEILVTIARLRSQWGKAKTTEDKMNNADAMGTELSRLLLLVEKYPNLKADEQCRTLQAQLEGTENRIAVERMRYNHSVKQFNIYSRKTVGGFFVKLKGVSVKREYFKTTDNIEMVPKVELN